MMFSVNVGTQYFRFFLKGCLIIIVILEVYSLSWCCTKLRMVFPLDIPVSHPDRYSVPFPATLGVVFFCEGCIMHDVINLSIIQKTVTILVQQIPVLCFLIYSILSSCCYCAMTKTRHRQFDSTHRGITEFHSSV